MKIFYLTGSVILTVIILILAFGNVQSSCSSLQFFFFPIELNTTIILLGMATIGILTGLLYHAFVGKVLEGGNEEEQEF